MAVSQLNDPLEFVVKEEKIDETMDCNTLVGAPIKFEDFSDNQETDTKELLTIKSEIIDENLQGEIILELMNNEGEMKGEIIDFSDAEFEEEKPQTSKKSKKDTNDWIIGHNGSTFYSPNKSLYMKLGLISDDWIKPSCYLCEFCGLREQRSARFYYHYITHLELSLVNNFECYDCGFKTIHKDSLIGHIKNMHSVEKQYLCDKCDFRTKKRFSLKKHQITHFEYKQIKIIVHKCDVCSYETKKKYLMDQHKKIHLDTSELEMFKCNLCPYQSKRKVNLTNHMKIHKKITEIKSYNCELCNYKSKYAHLLRNHIKINHKKFPKSLIRKCEKCSFETNNKYSLETHMKKDHKKPKEIKLFKCDQCSYVTNNKQRLKHDHALVHQNIMERIIYECYNCGAKFKTKKNLKQHIIMRHLMKLEL